MWLGGVCSRTTIGESLSTTLPTAIQAIQLNPLANGHNGNFIWIILAFWCIKIVLPYEDKVYDMDGRIICEEIFRIEISCTIFISWSIKWQRPHTGIVNNMIWLGRIQFEMIYQWEGVARGVYVFTTKPNCTVYIRSYAYRDFLSI